MGRFSGKSSAEARAKRDFIKVNPYEIPEKALAVIANICQKSNSDDANIIVKALVRKFDKKFEGSNWDEFFYKHRKDLYNIDLETDINQRLYLITEELMAHENTNDTQVVVAGGFSAGKSTFLNTLTGAGNLLPTGIEPISMVATYLYCSKQAKQISVKGINLKNAVVRLDTDILQSIQHESKSKTYLASVLTKLFVELPSESLDGLVFIDTPGYNNSDKANATNNRSDQDTALEAIGHGNVLIWIIDAGAGTIPAKDLNVITDFIETDDRHKVAIIFNKAEKKGEVEIRKIVDAAVSTLSKHSPAVIDVLGFSSHENKIYYSHKGYDMPRLLRELRKTGSGNSGVDRLISDILQIFDDEIEFAEMAIDERNNEKKELIKSKNDAFKALEGEKNGTKAYIEALREILVDSYDEVKSSLDKMIDVSLSSLNNWGDALDEIASTEKSNMVTHDSVLSIVYSSNRKRSGACDKHDKIIDDYSYFKSDYRKDWVEKIRVQLERVDENLNDEYERLEKEIKNICDDIAKYQLIARHIRHYRDTMKNVLYTTIKAFRTSAHKVQDARLDFGQTTDVFSAIRNGGYSEFLNCFAKGVHMSECNSEGYSPLTLAAKMGANDMVRFLIEQGADAHSEDKRGQDAIVTAESNGNHATAMLLQQ
jgi:hypothetical protein